MDGVQLIVASVPDLVSLLLLVGTRAHWLVHPSAVLSLFVAGLSDSKVFFLLGFFSTDKLPIGSGSSC